MWYIGCVCCCLSSSSCINWICAGCHWLSSGKTNFRRDWFQSGVGWFQSSVGWFWSGVDWFYTLFLFFNISSYVCFRFFFQGRPGCFFFLTFLLACVSYFFTWYASTCCFFFWTFLLTGVLEIFLFLKKLPLLSDRCFGCLCHPNWISKYEWRCRNETPEPSPFFRPLMLWLKNEMLRKRNSLEVDHVEKLEDPREEILRKRNNLWRPTV